MGGVAQHGPGQATATAAGGGCGSYLRLRIVRQLPHARGGCFVLPLHAPPSLHFSGAHTRPCRCRSPAGCGFSAKDLLQIRHFLTGPALRGSSPKRRRRSDGRSRRPLAQLPCPTSSSPARATPTLGSTLAPTLAPTLPWRRRRRMKRRRGSTPHSAARPCLSHANLGQTDAMSSPRTPSVTRGAPRSQGVGRTRGHLRR